MHLFPRVVVWLAPLTLVGVLFAQVPATAPTAAPAPAAGPAPASNVLQPSLGALVRTVNSLDPDRWKLPRALHDETRRNLDSIHRDVDGTLPGLMSAADAVPLSVPAEFALLRNVDALYDVALRIAATAEIAGPQAQSAALEQSLADLLQARRALGDRVAADAAAQQSRVGELQASLRTTSAASATVCPPVPTSTAAEKSKTKRAKPRPKPVTAPPPSQP